MSFDLRTQPWVPVVIGGRRTEVSLRQALCEAHAIDELAVDDPLETVAVLRQVLLPVVLHAFGAPRNAREWSERYNAGRFDPATVDAYLAERDDGFDLFHPRQPFAQVAGLSAANGETKPISLVLPHLASGNNVPLFSARTDADPPALTPAEAARTLLGAHCWDTAAIKSGAAGDPQMKAGKTTGNPTGPLGQLGVVVPLGATLFETLMLSVPMLPQGLHPGDRPQWDAGPQGPEWEKGKTPVGILELLTWQARRIRLVPTARDEENDLRIRSVVLCAGDRLQHTPHDIEPHTAWRIVDRPKGGEQPQLPERHRPDRSAWRGLATLVATVEPTSDKKSAPSAVIQVANLREKGVLPEDHPLRALVVGVAYGNQQAVIDDVVSDVLPLPIQALLDHDDNTVRATLLGIVNQAEQLRQAANHLGDDLRAAAGVEKMPWDRGQRLGELLVHAFTAPVRRILAGLAAHPQDAERAEVVWRITARRLAEDIAEPALQAMPATAFLGREQSTGNKTAPRDPEKRRFNRIAVAEAVYRSRLTTILGAPADLEAAMHELSERTSA